MFNVLTKVFGSRNERILKPLYTVVDQINALETEMQALSDSDLAAKTTEFRQQLANGSDLDDLLPAAFAVVREASSRVLGMRHFDTQLIGGMILHQGKIAEMKTGEGKTLVATLPVYLNALTEKGVHAVTVNDYLARRDSEWMGRVYKFLGMSVGVIVHGISNEERRAAYDADITYGTNNEYGFDYLRDNMAFSGEELVRQRPLYYAIVDEVDSILVDEARTPLIISGPAEQAGELYQQADGLIRKLDADDYEKDEKQRAVSFTEKGLEQVEILFREAGLLKSGDLYDPENVNQFHAATQALRAHTMFTREVDYIVKGGEVLIIDEFTGRMMPGRRYSDGLHQALEAKEHVKVQPENQTLASVTFQNFFRMYEKLAGMTGTADTEAEEFEKIYKLEVVILPTNMPMVREDLPDLVYRDEKDKYTAIIEDITERHEKGQPILVGTTSIEKSERLSELLNKQGVEHQVLNAKHHEREASIVAQAGSRNALTIATNMAGRGTDIVLGGNPDMLIQQLPEHLKEEDLEQKSAEIREACTADHKIVVGLGGLHIISSERHESRRIDNQLRGRSGRQGDPGSSRFYLSLEDDLMRIFGGEKMQAMLQKMGFNEGEVIEHPWVTKAIENSQKKVEGRNFDIRKQLLEYDDVMNQQREVIYGQRRELLDAEEVSDVIADMRRDYVHQLVERYIPAQSYTENWDLDGLQNELAERLDLHAAVREWVDAGSVESAEGMAEKVTGVLAESMQEKEDVVSSESMRHFEKVLILQILDHNWKEHLLAMDHLREGIGLRGYAQKQPLQEYKHESFKLFAAMIGLVREETMQALHRVRVEPEPQPEVRQPLMTFSHGDEGMDDAVPPPVTMRRNEPKVGRNQPCPCGSGKKYKQCHGRNQAGG